MGEVTDIPYGITYQPINLSFYLDNKFSARTLFENWTDAVYDRISRSVGYYKNYVKDITIVVLDRADDKVYEVTLYEAYPKTISDVALSYSSHDVLKLDVQLVFKYWRSKLLGAESIGRDEVIMTARSEISKRMDAAKMKVILPESRTEQIGNRLGGGAPTGDFGFGTDIGSELATWGPTMGVDCRRAGLSVASLTSASNITSYYPTAEGGYTTFGQDFGASNQLLGDRMGAFGNNIGALGRSLSSSVAAPANALAQTTGAVAGSVGSIGNLLNRMGIKNGLGKISADLAQNAGRLQVVSQLNGIPGALGSVGANLAATGAEFARASEQFNKLGTHPGSPTVPVNMMPGTTNAMRGALSTLGNVFNRRGNELSSASSSVQHMVGPQ
jgi:hypothetical protein